MVQNGITNALWYDDDKVQYSLPLNGPVSGNADMRFSLNTPIAKSQFSIFTMTNFRYSRSTSYVGRTDIGQSDAFTGLYYNEADGTMDYEAFHRDFFSHSDDGSLGLNLLDFFQESRTQTLSFTRGEDGSWSYDGDATFPVDPQAMEALVHNLNTMHSRAGAQVPFTSLNFGTDTSPSGRLVSKCLLEATMNGLGKHETPIFPISIFKVKEGINYNPEDPNYDLFVRSMEVSAKRLFPNFVFLDAPFNLDGYVPGDYRTEVATMGCRTRVYASVFPESNHITTGRGNISFTTINLPRLGIKHGICLGERKEADWTGFYRELDQKIDLVADQLLQRFEFQANQHVRNFPFLMGQGNWFGSEKLKIDDDLRDVIKHGTLSIGFIGLAETLVAMTGKHHGESEESQELGLDIVSHMRERCDELSQKHHLNFTLLGTPAEGLSGRFTRMDQKEYGKIKGVTDREFYTNSFHVPVYYPISAFDKIEIEAPYHALCNAGHITYVELDGDPSQNIAAFEAIIRKMKESGIGYGSVNHPVDRDPVCGFSGIIEGNRCPSCGRIEDDVPFERLRRITGYLVGTLDRWNDAKRAEEKARVKHGISTADIASENIDADGEFVACDCTAQDGAQDLSNKNGVYDQATKAKREKAKHEQKQAVGKA